MKSLVLSTMLTLLFAFTLLAAQEKQGEVPALTPGKPVARQLSGGETHRYTINLKSGEFLHAVIDQRGIDVVVALIGPDGKKVVEVDSPNGAQGAEPLFWIAEVTGEYKLEVRSPGKEAAPGRYEAKVVEVRASVELDKKRVAAQQAFIDATNRFTLSSPEARQEALRKFEEALPQWRETAELERQILTVRSIARIHTAMGQMQKAIEYQHQALAVFREIGDRKGEAATLNSIGFIHSSLGEKQKALDYYNQALPIRKAVGDRVGEATTLNNIGAAYSSLGEKRKALDYYSQALAIDRETGDRRSEANTLNNMGSIYDSIAEREKALDQFNQALPIERAIGNRGGEALTLSNIGSVYSSLGESQKALEHHKQALPIQQAIGDRVGEARTLNNIGAVYDSLGEKQRALDHYNLALPIVRAIGDREGEANSLNNIGGVYDSLGEKQKAFDHYNQALQIRRAIGDKKGEAIALSNIGGIYNALGQKPKALDLYKQALLIQRTIGDRSGEATTLNNIAHVHQALGEKEKALDYYGQALPIRRAVGDRIGEANTLHNLGAVYASLGQYQKSLNYHNQALPILIAVGHRVGEATTLNSIGHVYYLLHEQTKALQYFNQALPIWRAVGHREGESSSLGNIGAVYAYLGQNQRALDYYHQALPIQRAISDVTGEASTLTNIGSVYDALGQKEKALEYYNQAWPIEKAIGNRDGEALLLINLMWLWRGTNPSLAVFYGKQSVNLYQQLRGNIKGLDRDLQASYVRSAEQAYRILADVLISQARLPEAQAVLDLLKEEEFSQLVRGTNTTGEVVPYSAAESEAIKLVDQLATIGRQRRELLEKQGKLKQGGQDLERTENEQLNKLEEQIGVANKELRRALDALALAESSASNRVDEIKKEQSLMRDLRELGAGTVALYTVLATESSAADRGRAGDRDTRTGWIIFVTADFRKAYPIDITNLEQTVFAFRETLRTDKYDPRPLAQRLYRMLFLQTSAQQKTTLAADLDAYLRNAEQKTLMWSLDGVLRYVPMAALHDGQQYLIERYRNVVFNPKSLGSLKDASTKAWTALGLGVTEAREEEGKTFSALTGAERELRAIVREGEGKGATGILPGIIRLNRNFNKQTMIEGLREGHPLVHIASHFSFNAADPEKSFLLLGQDHLSVGELQDMSNPFERVELLTLSACDTAMGSANGKEVEGFAYTAQSLGAKSVIASLWPVSDEGTDALMTNFYRLRRDDLQLPKGEAFRQAQLSLLSGTTKSSSEQQAIPASGKGGRADLAITESLRKDVPPFQRDPKKPLAHPYYWAPFILIGNWK